MSLLSFLLSNERLIWRSRVRLPVKEINGRARNEEEEIIPAGDLLIAYFLDREKTAVPGQQEEETMGDGHFISFFSFWKSPISFFSWTRLQTPVGAVFSVSSVSPRQTRGNSPAILNRARRADQQIWAK